MFVVSAIGFLYLTRPHVCLRPCFQLDGSIPTQSIDTCHSKPDFRHLQAQAGAKSRGRDLCVGGVVFWA